jgi:hypothetical protein
MQAKHIIGDFEGSFVGAKTFLTPKIVLNAAEEKALWTFNPL